VETQNANNRFVLDNLTLINDKVDRNHIELKSEIDDIKHVISISKSI